MRFPHMRAAARHIGLKSALQRTTGTLGFDAVRRDFYSPIPDWRAEPESRWSEPSALRGIGFDIDAQLEELERLARWFPEFSPPLEAPGGDRSVLHLDNGFYGPLDADILHATVRDLRPSRVLELGSGYSSLIIGAAAERNRADGHPLRHDVYDPYARADLQPGIRDVATLHAVSAVDVPLDEFTALGAGDVLFVDTTHTVKLGSDVNFVVLEVLPVLAPGVVVHFHDIFLPWEYPRVWFETLEVYWAEQYLLQAYLSGNPGYEVVLGSAAVLRAAPDRVGAVVPHLEHRNHPGAFWLRRRGEA